MKINVFGMGYVGCVSAACLANEGHEVTGIDIDKTKIRMINSGKSPLVERDLEEAIKKAVDSGRLKAVNNDLGNLHKAHASIVCVGTPSNENGSLNLESMQRISEQIGDYLRSINIYHLVNVRSTVIPGTLERIIIPLIEDRSQKKAGVDFGVCMNPEFLREGTSIHDFYNPPFTLIGELDKKSGDRIAKIYKPIKAPIIRTTIKVAEMIKYTCNSFHALKVTFGNEIGNICKKLNIDSHEVMEIFCKDTKLNLSPYYLKPGFAFGGSCLPKDLRALLYEAKKLDLDTPVLSSIMQSNKAQIDRAYDLVKRIGKKKVGVLGLSFKPGTDDLRESPTVELIEKLIGKGYKISIYDKEVSLAKISGSNKRYIEGVIPHISSLMKKSFREIIDNSEVIVISEKSKEANEIASNLNKDKIIIDLVRATDNLDYRDDNYEGLCW